MSKPFRPPVVVVRILHAVAGVFHILETEKGSRGRLPGRRARMFRYAIVMAIAGALAVLAAERTAKSDATSTAGSTKDTATSDTTASKNATASKKKSKAKSKGAEKSGAAAKESSAVGPQEPGGKDDEAQEREVEHESPELARERAEWFHYQRAYPFKRIPAGALQRALAQRDAMKARQQQQSGGGVQPDSVITFPGNGLWQLTGPQPVDFPFGAGTNEGNPTASGRITAVAVDPSTPTTVYAGGAAGGVWKSTDSGAHWTPLTDSQPSLAVGSIAIDPNSCSPAPCQTIYVGTGESNFNGDAFYGAGILKSTNAGATWTQLGASDFVGPFAAGVGGAQIGAIAVQPGNSNVVLAAVYFFDGTDTNGGIWISTNGGTTWGRPTTGAQGSAGTAVVFDPNTPANVYAALGDPFGATSNGIYKSTDSGVHWTLLAGGLPTANVGRITLGYARSTTGSSATIYAAIADASTSSSTLLGLFKTTNGGTAWSTLTGPAGGFCNSQCYYDMSIGVHPTNANVVVIGGGAYQDNFTSLFESTNGGTSWTPANSAAGDFMLGATSVNPHVDTHAIVFNPSGSSLYIGDDGGMWRTDNPQPGAGVSPTWVDLNATLATLQFYPGPSMSPGDDNYGMGGTQDNGSDLFSGTLDWTWLDTCGDGGPTVFDTQTPTTVYVACSPLSSSSPIWKSVFYGQNIGGFPTFNPAAGGISQTDRSLFIPPFTIDGTITTNLYYGTCRMWQTTDGANTWNAISGDLTAGNAATTCPSTAFDNITTIKVASNNSEIVYAGTSNGLVWETPDVTAGASATWTEIDNGLLPNRYVTAVREDKGDSTGNTLYVTFSGFGSCSGCDGKGHLFKTTNGGTSWSDISGDLPDAPVNDIIVDTENSGTFHALYIGTDVGVFGCANPQATTPCTNWTVIGDGLPNSPVLGLTARKETRILQAATHGRSMWNIQLRDMQAPSVASVGSLTPAAVMVGTSPVTVTVTGVNFSTNTTILFDGISVGTPTFVNTTQLTIQVPTTLLTTGFVYQVTASDPQGASTQSLPFTVMNPTLTANTMTPSSTTTYTPVTLTFSGSSFVPGTAVTFNGNQLFGTVTGGGSGFSVPVAASLLTTVGSVTVTITNPLPGGGPTPATAFPFTITANPGPLAIVSPSPIILGPTNVGTTTPVTNVSITNPGTTNALHITAQSIAGTNAANFSFATPTSGTNCNFPTSGQTGTASVTLAAGGGTCNFGITYTAAVAQGENVSIANLNLTDNAAGSPQVTLIEGIPNGSTSIVELTPVNFGGVAIGTTSPTMNSTLVNFTSSTLTVSAPGLTISGTNAGDFQLVPAAAGGNTPCAGTTSFTVPADSSCDIGVTFTPSIPGSESAQINATDNGPGSPQNAALSGIGIEVTSISPSIVATGGPAFTLTVNGGGFASNAVVNVQSDTASSSSARLTTFVSSSQLQASIPASDIATAGSLAITVTSGGTTSEPKTLFVVQAPPATDDNINFAYSVSATPFRVTQDTTQATENTGGVNDPTTSCGSNSIARSVWFKFVAPANGKVIADTRYSSYTTILSAWTGTPGALTLVSGACANGNVPASSPIPAQSLIGFNVTNGTTYYLMVTDQNTAGAGGTLTFSLDFASAAPANDPYSAATNIATAPYSTTENTILATANTGATDPTPSCASGTAGLAGTGVDNSVWFSYTAPSNGTITADTLTSTYYTILTAVTGAPGSFTQVACNVSASSGINQSQVSFAATSGTKYYFMVSSVLGDGGTTNFHLTFGASTGNPVPTITSFSPTSTTAGGAAFTLTINGTNFVSGATGTFNGNASTVTFVNATQVTMAVTAADIATAGSFPVVITNPAPGGGSSTPSNFPVNNPVPTITSLSPTNATAGGAAFTLTVTGTNFVAGSVVNFNGTAQTTTFVSATQITAAITAAEIATAGSDPVTVTNPTPGGGTSAASTFTVNNPTPTISSLSPTGATAGGAAFTLTVNGTNFVSTSAVKFNGTAVTTTFVNATQVTAAIPATDIVTAGTYPVTVTNPAPGGGTSNSVNFSVSAASNPVPTLTSILPTNATAGGAAFTLTLTGTNFISSSVVNFNGAAQTTTFVSATQLTAAITAAEIATGGTVNVTVTNPAPGGGTSGAQTFTINNPVPTITSLSPTNATAGGAAFTLTVNGTNFVSTSAVKFNGTAVTTTFVSSTQVTAAIPAADIATAGSFPVTVTNPTPGGATSSATNFAVNNPVPTITSFSPTSATAGGAAFTLTINGTNFVSGSTGTFNGNARTVTFVSATQVTMAVTAADIATAGSFPVVITDPAPGGGSSTPSNFPVNNPVPTITSLSPTSANAGGAAFTLTVNGTNFVSTSAVKFNGTAVTTTFVNSTQVTAAIPATAIATAGSFPVTVTNPTPGGGTSSATNFAVNNPTPTITSLSPTGATAGGAAFTLTVNGTGFVAASSVSFNGTTATTTFVSSTQLTAAITAAEIATAGTYPVIVTNPTPGGGASAAVNFNVSAANNPVPTLTSISPTSATAGGAAFTLTATGTNFVSSSVVNFNGAAKTTTFVSATQITAAITAADIAAGGTVNVTVTNPAPGGGTTSAQTFTINNPTPTITSLSPTNATAGGTAFTLTINGTGFVSTSSVKFNGNAKTTTFVSATQITAAITAADIATAGSFPVTVTNPTPGGGTSTATNFAVNNPIPTITSFSPTSATAGGAAFTLTINGTNFVTGATGTFNGNARTVTFVSATQVSMAVTAADIATAGSFPVIISDPAPGGGASAASNFAVNNPAPTITSLSPTGVTAGGAAFTLTVNGTGFISSSVVNFNGTAAPTTFVSSTQITAAITAAQIATAGNANVTVINPTPGGGTSTVVVFNISSAPNPVPTLSSISPTSATAGGAAFTLTVNGTNYVSSSVVNFNGSARTTTVVSATQLTTAVTAADIATAGSFPITVFNPAPGGGTSSAINLKVNNPVPSITTLSPASATVGGAAFTLTITGSNFASGATGTFNGNARTVTYVSATQVTMAVTAADIAAVGTFPVVVTNPAPGGGSSTAANFSVTNPTPTITSLSPTSATAGGAAFTLTVTGTNFVTGSAVNFNGNAKVTTFVNSTQITAAITAADIATAGTVNVTVTNPAPGGGTSGNATFTINNPVPTLTAIAPTSGVLNQSVNLVLTGTNFVSGSVVNFGTNADSGGVVSNGGTTLTITIPATQLSTAGAVSVTVTNPTPGGGTTSAKTFTVNNPVPTLTSISPTFGTVGQSVNLTLTGTNFVTGSVVNFGTNADTGGTVSNNGTSLTITIPAAQLSTAGTVNVTVTNPTPGGGTSSAQTFTVDNPLPTLTAVTPTTGVVGQSVNLTLTGTNFITGSVVNFGTNADSGGVVSNGGTTLAITIPAAQLTTAGTVTITVKNPAPGGGTSAGVQFTVQNVQPVETSLSPQSTTAGGAAFTLTINGSGFVSGATVSFGSTQNLSAATLTATKITVSIPATAIATAGTYNVVVTNPAPAVGPSLVQTFTVNNPAPTLASATSSGQNHIAGGAAFTLTVNGTNFVNGTSEASVVNFNSKAETTTFVSATQVTAAIPATDVSNAGSVNVTVTNPTPGGGTTTAVLFTIDGYTLTGPGSAVTVKAGQSATIPVILKPTANGFANSVTFTVSGLPAHTALTPISITPGSTQQTVNLVITTKAEGAPPPSSPVNPPSPLVLRLMFSFWLAALLAGLYAALVIRRTPRLRRYAAVVPLALLLLTGALIVGCAGMGGTPHGTSTLTITATSGTLSQTTSATLMVN
jgi:hypothetical protein